MANETAQLPLKEVTETVDVGRSCKLLRKHATPIIVLASCHSVLDVFGLISEFRVPTGGMVYLGVPEHSILLLVHLAQLFGGVNMHRIGSYRVARIGTALACVPLCSPFLILGIPFGINAQTILRRDSCKRLFQHTT